MPERLRENAIGLGNPEALDPKKAKVAATALTAWRNEGTRAAPNICRE